MNAPASPALAATAAATPRALASTVGRKAVMAVTGLILVGFVIGHMLGNLQVYAGAEALDAYGRMLRSLLHGGGLWIARIVLLAATALHVWAAWAVRRVSIEARPIGYRRTRSRASTYASRTMRWSGPILALFVIYHLLHFTTGTVHPHFEEGRVYANLVSGFSVWPVSLFYILAMLALGLHLYHGIFSMIPSLGLGAAHRDRLRRGAAAAITLVVVAGNISIPLAVLAGWVR